MKKWIIRGIALLCLGIFFVVLDYIIVEFIGSFMRAQILQDETTEQIYKMIIESNVDVSKLRIALGTFEGSIFGKIIFGILLCSGVIFIYQSTVKLLEKIIR